MSNATWRAFFAVALSDPLREQTAALIAELHDALPIQSRPHVRWAKIEGLHITLKFLASVTNEQASELHDSVSQAMTQVAPFAMDLGGLGAFPDSTSPEVLWVAIGAGRTQLESLQSAVASTAADLGFEPEARAFTAHLTLGRVKAAARHDVASLLHQHSPVLGTQAVDHVALYRSDLSPEGSIYTKLSTIQLSG